VIVGASGTHLDPGRAGPGQWSSSALTRSALLLPAATRLNQRMATTRTRPRGRLRVGRGLHCIGPLLLVRRARRLRYFAGSARRLGRPARLVRSVECLDRSLREHVLGPVRLGAGIRRRNGRVLRPIPPRQRHARNLRLKRELQSVKVSPVPWQEKRIVVLTPAEWHAMPAGEIV